MTLRLLLVVLIWIALAVTLSATERTRVEQAIIAAVQARMGSQVSVYLDELTIDVPEGATGDVIATLPPDARFGARLRAILRMPRADGQATRAGAADVVVHATATVWAAARALSRNDEIGPGDVAQRVTSLDGLRMQALSPDVQSTKLTRDVVAGQVLLPHMLQPVPVVRRGDQVTIAVRLGSLVVSTLGVAAGEGRIGQAVKVTTTDSGKPIVARVVGRGAVEVRHGS